MSSSPVYIFPDGKEVYLLDASEAAERILVDAPGSFFALLTQTDLSVRMGTEGVDGTKGTKGATGGADAEGVAKPSLEQFKTFVGQSVRDWTDRERQAMTEVLRLVHEQCGEAFASLIPRKWRFIKTSGAEEFGYFYTRGDCIVIPGPAFNERLAGGDKAKSETIGAGTPGSCRWSSGMGRLTSGSSRWSSGTAGGEW